MTRERVDKRAVRDLQEATGVAYADAVRLKAAFEKVLEEQPRLTYFGFGIFQQRGQTLQERQQEFAQRRTRLAAALPNVVKVYLWLRRNVQPIKTPAQGSYGLKHLAENVLGDYVSNGELIAAAIMAGYPMSTPHGPNANFAMSKRDIDRQRARAREERPSQRDVYQGRAILDEFSHLPLISDRDGDRWPCPTVGQHRAALGAIELALRDSWILDGVQQRDRWRTIDGHIDLDWVGGPYAWEVVRELLYFAENPNTGTIEPGELSPGINALGELNAVWLDGVRVRFRPFRPTGLARSRIAMWRHAEQDEPSPTPA
ncbi:hypothetical protein [Amycolatopsis sp. lyj-108]|uniref:hypothetical protein n=1 Tax=Amycolatopsis sp. lyj-108 TaxID=2789286 RepID=UPI0039791F57